MQRFPKRNLRRLRKQAIEAVHVVAMCENSWGARNIEKQYATIEDLRKMVQAAEKSIGGDRVKFILNHNVPQVRSLLDLTNPRANQRGDLLPKQHVEAVLANIDLEIERIATSYWRLLTIPSFVVALLGVIGFLARGQFWEPKQPRNTDTPGPSPTPSVSTPSATAADKSQPPAETSLTASPTSTTIVVRTPTPLPSPTATSPPVEVPTPTPSPPPTPTPTPKPALPARTPISTPESAPQTKRLRLGDLLVEVVGLSNGGKGLLRLDVTLTNAISKTLYVFAGSAPLTVFDVPRAQALTGTASDELNNAYALDSIQGFTTERDFYFGGVNSFLELPPSESSSVTFIFKVTSLYWDNSRPPRRVSLNVELAVVGDPSIKGSHRTRSLSLTRQSVE